MKLRNYLTLFSIIGGLALAVSTASANCGACGYKDQAACPADCTKECCKDKQDKHPADCACDACKEKKAKHPADCTCDGCKKKDS